MFQRTSGFSACLNPLISGAKSDACTEIIYTAGLTSQSPYQRGKIRRQYLLRLSDHWSVSIPLSSGQNPTKITHKQSNSRVWCLNPLISGAKSDGCNRGRQQRVSQSQSPYQRGKIRHAAPEVVELPPPSSQSPYQRGKIRLIWPVGTIAIAVSLNPLISGAKSDKGYEV